MTRIKGGVIHSKHRKGILKYTKGFRWGRKSKMKLAKTAKMRAGQHAFVGRKVKKRQARGLWQIKINAACRKHDLSYSKFMGGLKKAGVTLDRKVMAEIAAKYPKMFAELVAIAKK